MVTDTSNPNYPPDTEPQSDPDLYFFVDGNFRFSLLSGAANEERETRTITGPEVYIAELLEWRFFDPATTDFDPDLSTIGVSEPVCYTITITAQ